MIIGLTGKKGSGKDTIGLYLTTNHRFQRVAFADPLKFAVANLFDIPVERVDHLKDDYTEVILQVGRTTDYTYSWREFLQRFGTEMGRNTFGYDFWVDQWQETVEPLLDEDIDIVVTDVRFNNEAERIKGFDGYIAEVQRPGHEPDGHVSEAGIDWDYIDCAILNDGSKSQLNRDIEQLLEDIISGM